MSRRTATALVAALVVAASACGPVQTEADWDAQQEADQRQWEQERDANLAAARTECDKRDGQWLATYDQYGAPREATCLPAGVTVVDLGKDDK